MKCSSTSIVVLQISIGSPLLQRIFVMHSGSPRIATIARVVQIGPSTGPSLAGGGGALALPLPEFGGTEERTGGVNLLLLCRVYVGSDLCHRVIS